MLWSDAIGILAGICLVLPPARDNYFRLQESRQRRADDGWPGLRVILADAWRQKRDGYSALDSVFIALGGLGLIAAFGLKGLGA